MKEGTIDFKAAPAAGWTGHRGIHVQGTAEDFAWAFE